MKTATLGHTGGLSGKIGDDFRKIQRMLDGDEIQLALNNAEHPFRAKVRELALRYFQMDKIESPAILGIDRGTPFSPAPDYSIWRGPAISQGLEGEEDQDRRSVLITKLNPSGIDERNIHTGLRVDEFVISGEIKRARLILKMIPADAKLGQTLLREEGQKTLRFLYDILDVKWLEFLGTVLRNPQGHRCSLCACRENNGSWEPYYDELNGDRDGNDTALCFNWKV